MQTQDTVILGRIQKLLALSEGTHSADEAASAMMKVQELLLSHGLTMGQVEDLEGQTSTIEKTVDHHFSSIRRARMPWWWGSIAEVVANNFRCYMYYSNKYDYEVREKVKTVVLIGLDSDVSAAILTVKFAISSAISCFDTWRKETNAKNLHIGKSKVKASAKNDYMFGFIDGLKQKFVEQVTEKALVLVKDALVTQEFNTLKLGKSSGRINLTGNDSARQQGERDGRMSKRGAYLSA